MIITHNCFKNVFYVFRVRLRIKIKSAHYFVCMNPLLIGLVRH